MRAGIIVCTEVLEHLEDPSELLTSIRTKIMQSGSRIVISVPGGPRSAYDLHIGHRPHFTKHRLTDLLTSTGFEEVRVFRSGFPVFNLYKLAVMALGKRLVSNASQFAGNPAKSARSSEVITKLMELGPRDSPLGWQLFATARVP